MNGLEKIVNKILAEAEEYRAAITAEFSAKADTLSGEYAGRASELRKKYAADATTDAADRIARAEASAETTARRATLAAKSELLDDVFARALTALRSLGDEETFALLTRLATDAVTERARFEAENAALYGAREANVSAQYELLLNADDREKYGARLVGEVRRQAGASGEKLTLAADTASIDGGMVLRCGEIEICASLSSLVAGARDALEGEVCRILFD